MSNSGNQQSAIRVVLADDHALVIEGLRGLLEQQPDIEFVGAAEDGEALLTLLKQAAPVDLVVLDLQMPYHGLHVLQEIRNRNLPVKVLVLTAFMDGETIQSALELHAEGIALKTESPIQTIEAIRQVMQGRLVYPQATQRWLLAQQMQHDARNPLDELSSRELEVINRIADGATNLEIALDLSISDNTVRYHLKNIYSKLNVSNRTEAAAFYLQYKRATVIGER
jgi:DNA-binding NarL/FixJ family response regulator